MSTSACWANRASDRGRLACGHQSQTRPSLIDISGFARSADGSEACRCPGRKVRVFGGIQYSDVICLALGVGGSFMSLGERIRDLTRLAFQLGNNWMTLAGAALTTSSAFVLVWFWFMELTDHRQVHPYAGILLFLILPGLFLVGLVLIPLGILRVQRNAKRAGQAPLPLQAVDESE